MWFASLAMLYMFHLHNLARAALRVDIKVSVSQVVETYYILNVKRFEQRARFSIILGIGHSNSSPAMSVFSSLASTAQACMAAVSSKTHRPPN